MPDKACRHCGEVKPLDAFHRHPQTADGHLNVCKPCRNAYCREYMRGNAEQRKRKNDVRRALRDSDREKYNAEARRQQQAARLRNPEFARFHAAKRRRAPYTAAAREYIKVLLKDPCSYCGGPGGEIDHIVPISKGGTGEWDNLTAACRSCNARKHNKSLLVFLLELSAPSSTTPVLGTSRIEVA